MRRRNCNLPEYTDGVKLCQPAETTDIKDVQPLSHANIEAQHTQSPTQYCRVLAYLVHPMKVLN